MQTKEWYKSRTLWLNIMAIVVIMLETAIDVVPLTPERMTIVLAVINILVRLQTSTAIR
jgi:hypothetical protein